MAIKCHFADKVFSQIWCVYYYFFIPKWLDNICSADELELDELEVQLK